MRRGARMIGFTLLPVIATVFALSASAASANVRDHVQPRDQCQALHVVVVKGAVTAAASGSSSLTANVRILREERFDPGRFGIHDFDCSGMVTAPTTSTTPAGSPTQTSMGMLTFGTSSSTSVRMTGSASTSGSVAVGDEIIAAFIVPRHQALSANANLTAVRLVDLGAASSTTGH